MPSHRRGPWSNSEDNYLVQLVEQSGPNNWVRISQILGTRSPKQCRERYHQNLKPTLNHSPISPEEGELIEKLVSEMGKRWAEIARRLNGRSDNAVKNWWNGGQNRRKRKDDRRVDDNHREMDLYGGPQEAAFQHRYAHGDARQHHRLPPPPAMEHSHTSGSMYSQQQRPYPLDLNLYHARGRAFDTPIPSPSGLSMMSAEGAPSLVTDNGSDTRSPHWAASPIALAPLCGTREERRRSSVLYLPATGFATDDEQNSDQLRAAAHRHEEQKPAPYYLPEPRQYEDARRAPPAAAPVFREPNYNPISRAQRPGLLIESSFSAPTLRSHVAASSAPRQLPLPSFQTLAEPGKVPEIRNTQLPTPQSSRPTSYSPYTAQKLDLPQLQSSSPKAVELSPGARTLPAIPSPAAARSGRASPSSPNRDPKMSFNNLLS